MLLLSNVAKLLPHRHVRVLGTVVALSFLYFHFFPQFWRGVHQNGHFTLIPGHILCQCQLLVSSFNSILLILYLTENFPKTLYVESIFPKFPRQFQDTPSPFINLVFQFGWWGHCVHFKVCIWFHIISRCSNSQTKYYWALGNNTNIFWIHSYLIIQNDLLFSFNWPSWSVT